MKRFIRKVAIAFLSGAAVALMCAAVSAGVGTGSMGYYNSEGYYYMAHNQVVTGSSFGWGSTSVESQKVENYFPAGYVGIEPRLYDSSTNKIVVSGSMIYNTSESNIFTQNTPTYYKTSGSFYSEGITRAYTSDKNAIYYPYYQYGTFASPIQSIPG